MVIAAITGLFVFVVGPALFERLAPRHWVVGDGAAGTDLATIRIDLDPDQQQLGQLWVASGDRP